jgi:pilus assembly protein CpaB
MKKRLLSVLVFALAVSAGATFVLYQLIASKVKADVSSAPHTTKVFVAGRDLELGAMVQEKDLRLQEFLTPPPGAISKKEDLIGRGVINPIHEDTPFFNASLAPVGGGAGFAATIPKGMRAFALHVNDVVGVAGFAVAGMRVDVLVSGMPRRVGTLSDSDGAISRTLLQNVEVLSAGQNYQKDAEGKPVLVQVVNILVTPPQAEIMNLAADQKIQLVLRNPADHDVVETPGAMTASLFEGGVARAPSPVNRTAPAVYRAPPPPPPPAPPANVTIEVFSGDKKSQSIFPGASPELKQAEPKP